MIEYNENVTVHGWLSATEVDGQAGEILASVIESKIADAIQNTIFPKMEEREQLLREELKNLTDKYNAAVESFNTAVATVNNLSERLAALEANYDPTIIK